MANETNTDVVQLNTSIEAAQWVADRDKLLAESQGVTQVTNDAELEKAGSIEARGKKLIKKLETARKEVTSPIDELKKKIMAREKDLRANIETEVTRINKMTTAYATEQARKAEEERRRIEQMERERAEAELAAQQAAAADPFGFNAAPAVPAAPAPVPVPTVQKPHTTSNRFVEVWNFQIVDEKAIPRELLSPDEKKIRALMNLKKSEGYKADQLCVAGIKFTATTQVYSR